MDESFAYDPFSFAVHADPWIWYRRLRADFPVYHNGERGFWALSRFHDVQAAGRDWRTFSSAEGVELDGAPDLYTELFGPGDFLNLDPEAHDRLRKVVHDSFTPRRIRDLRAAIHRRTIELTEALIARGSADLAQDFSWRLPLFGISRITGFPDDDLPYLQRILCDLLVRAPDDDPLPQRAQAAARQAQQYVRDLLAERRRRPRGDLLSEITCAERAGILKASEVDGLCFVMFGAGMDTTATVISTGLALLSEMPAERQLIAADPDRAARFNEEVTRHQCPVHGVARKTTQSVQLHNVEIPAGEWIWLIYASACRDERVFPDPDRLHLDRPTKRHLGFGDGIHHCIGAPLARLIGQIAFQQFCSRAADYQVGADVELMHNHSVPRGVVRMPITVG